MKCSGAGGSGSCAAAANMAAITTPAGVNCAGAVCAATDHAVCCAPSDGYAINAAGDAVASACTATEVANSDRSDEASIEGTTGADVSVTCNDGYTGSGTAICGTDGNFNAVTCAASACTATEVANSDRSDEASIAGTTGEDVSVTCNDGYTGSGTAICGTDGNFITVTCVASACTATEVANSDYSVEASIEGTTGADVTVTCNTGYQGSGATQTATCGTDGNFNTVVCVTQCSASGGSDSCAAAGNMAAIATPAETNCATTTCAATDHAVCCTPSDGYNIPADGTAVLNVCTAKADAAAWTALGCAVTTADATGVAGLGTVTAAAGYASCAITCPTTEAAFVVDAVGNTCTCPNGTPTVATGTTAGTLCDVAGVDCSTCDTGYTISATAAAAGSQTCLGALCSTTTGSESCAAAATDADAPATNMAVSNFNLPCTLLSFFFIQSNVFFFFFFSLFFFV